MRQKNLVFITIILCLLFCILVGCDGNQPANSDLKVHFIANNQVIDTSSLDDENLVLPIPPVLDDMTFEGWYMDSNFTIPFDMDEMLQSNHSSDVNVYAKYIENEILPPTYTISFIVNDDIIASHTVAKLTDITMPEDPVMDNYLFKGWYEDINYTIEFNPKFYIEHGLTNDLTLYANMQEKCASIHLYVDSQLHDTIIAKKSEADIAIPYPYIENMDFEYWLDKSTNMPFDRDKYFASDELYDINLEAIYSQNVTLVTLVMHDNTTKTITLNKGEKLVLPSINDTPSFIFEGWLLDNKIFDVETYNNDIRRGDIVLTEKVKPRISNITFMVDDSTYATTVVDASLVLDMPCNPSKTGYIFNGWYINNDNTKSPFDKSAYLESTERKDITLIANFTKATATVHFIVDGQIVAINDVDCDNLLALPSEPIKTNYVFKYWSIDGNNAFNVDDFNSDMLHGKYNENTIEINAIFVPNITHIQFMIDKYKEHAYLVFDVTKEFIMPNNPVEPNKIFEGWYTTPDFSTKFDIDKYANDVERTDITLYAKFI